MTFNQLETFLSVVDNGSVSGAAADRFVSAPAVSASLSTLQAEMGIDLVVRNGRGLRVTPAGLVFARYARQMLRLRDESRAATAEALDPERGRVRLAAVTTAGEHVLPRFLASFRARHPAAEVSLEVGNRERLWQMLAERDVDLAIGGRPPGGSGFVSLATRPNVLVIVAAKGHMARTGARPNDLDALAHQVVLLREPGSGTRSTAEELFDELGVSPPILTLGSNGAIRESVQVGLGVTLISRDAVSRELEEGTLEEWPLSTLPRHRAWHLVARQSEELPPTATLFLGHLTAAQPGSTEPGFAMVSPPALVTEEAPGLSSGQDTYR